MDHRTPEQRALAAARIAYVRAAARHYAAPSLASINAWVAACSVVLRAADRANGKDTPWTSAC